uniref:Uncharacterized protein n=1 Tax=Eimeria tenella TaxID=5802 RepID=H9B996_EIMTE|nr:hypothetical protein [Eimeria tenella]
MALSQFLPVACAALCAWAAAAVEQPLVDDFSPTAMYVHDAIAAAEHFDPEHRRNAQEELLAAAEQTVANEDPVQKLVWRELFRFSSMVYEDVEAWAKMGNVDLEEHLQSLINAEHNPYEETEYSAAVRECMTSELRLDWQAARIEHVFEHALRTISVNEQQDPADLMEKYEPLARFLNELKEYFARRRGQAVLYHRKHLLEMLANHGDKAAPQLLLAAEDEIKEKTKLLLSRMERLESAAQQCYESGQLFKGAVTFIKGLHRVGYE